MSKRGRLILCRIARSPLPRQSRIVRLRTFRFLPANIGTLRRHTDQPARV